MSQAAKTQACIPYTVPTQRDDPRELDSDYGFAETNRCLLTMPLPSWIVTISPAATLEKLSLLPSVQLTDRSASCALARPKCSRVSLCEMKEHTLRTSSICVRPPEASVTQALIASDPEAVSNRTIKEVPVGPKFFSS